MKSSAPYATKRKKKMETWDYLADTEDKPSMPVREGHEQPKRSSHKTGGVPHTEAFSKQSSR